MPKTLFLIPSLEYGGAARQLVLLASGLPRPEVECRACVFGPPAPWAEALAGRGVPVVSLGWERLLDVRPLLRLRALVRDFRPDVLHAWGLASLRAALLVKGGGRVVVSRPFRPCFRRPGRLDRWHLARADCVVAGGQAEAACCRRLGVPAERLVVIPPAVGLDVFEGRRETGRPPGPPPGARLLACVGPLAAHKGFREAVWAFDILRFLYDDLHLVFVGRGPEQRRLADFARALEVQERVHFLGPRASAADVLAAADVVWVPGRAGGVNAALEAMGAGRPVVAGRRPGLAEVVADGVTGVLVPPGDVAELARRTRLLLDAPDERRRLGRAGRRRVAEQFPVEALVRRYVRLYSRPLAA